MCRCVCNPPADKYNKEKKKYYSDNKVSQELYNVQKNFQANNIVGDKSGDNTVDFKVDQKGSQSVSFGGE